MANTTSSIQPARWARDWGPCHSIRPNQMTDKRRPSALNRPRAWPGITHSMNNQASLVNIRLTSSYLWPLERWLVGRPLVEAFGFPSFWIAEGDEIWKSKWIKPHSEIHILPTNMSKQWVKGVGCNIYEDDWIITDEGSERM